MIKIKISDLESRLGKTIKTHFSSIGVDTASKTGIGFITTDANYAIVNWSLISFEANNIQELYKQMYKEFDKFIDKSVDFVVVEDVFLGMNPDTTIKLARFGGLVLACAINNDIPFATIGAKSARAKLFKLDPKKYKGRTKEAVAEYLQSIGIKIDENNCADGIILALLGIIEGLDFRTQAAIKKAKAKKKRKKTCKRHKNML
jgi:Holliday junction resolvasome RuvABC endonuclease subunit